MFRRYCRIPLFPSSLPLPRPFLFFYQFLPVSVLRLSRESGFAYRNETFGDEFCRDSMAVPVMQNISERARLYNRWALRDLPAKIIRTHKREGRRWDAFANAFRPFPLSRNRRFDNFRNPARGKDDIAISAIFYSEILERIHSRRYNISSV